MVCAVSNSVIATALGLVGILSLVVFRPSPQIVEAAGQAPKTDAPTSADDKAVRQATNDYLGCRIQGRTRSGHGLRCRTRTTSTRPA